MESSGGMVVKLLDRVSQRRCHTAVRIDYSDQNGSTSLDFDLQGDDEEMTVKREILDPWAFAAP